MTNVIAYHGNGLGYTNKDTYLDLKEYILSKDTKYKLPDNLLCLTWSNYVDKVTDAELTYSNRGYGDLIRLGIDAGLGDWYQYNKIVSAKDEKEWVNINKYFLLKDFLLTYDLSKYDYVICMDAGDVLIDGDFNELIEYFESLNCNTLFNSEVNMFHDKRTQLFQEQVNRDSGIDGKEKRYKYLNSGFYITRKDELYKLVDFVLEDFLTMLTTSDQCICHNYYKLNYPNVRVDLNDDVTQCLFDNIYIRDTGFHNFIYKKYGK